MNSRASLPTTARPFASPVLTAKRLTQRPRLPRPRRAAVDSVITVLTVLALILGWINSVVLVETAGIKVTPEGKLVMVEVKNALFYASHGLAIASVMAAGILSLLSGRLRSVRIGTRIAFFLLISITIIWAFISYPLDEALSTEIFGATGPFVWLTLIFILAGMDRHTWTYLDRVMRVLAYLSSALALRALVTTEYGYYMGYSKYLQYAVLLTWLGGWTLLTATGMRGWRLLFRSLPAMVLLLMAIAGQARSWVIIACLLGIIFVYLRARERGSIMRAVRALVLACLAVAVGGGLVYMALPDKLSTATSGLAGRLDDDTRTRQYVDFFEAVPPADLILGRGPKGSWHWPKNGDYKFFDNGYLWTLFEGGIPIFICYVAILLWPAFHLFRKRANRGDTAAVWLVLVWAVTLTGLSTYILPSVNLPSYLVSLFAGRCHLMIAERRSQRKLQRARVFKVAATARVVA